MSSFPARVIATSGSRCSVDVGEEQPLRLSQRRNRQAVLCGDRVSVAGGVIEAIAPRRNTFYRADRDGDKQPIAANIDLALIVISSEPAPTRDLIARYVIGCADSNVEPLLVINKSDLFSDYEAFLSWLRETTAVHEIGVQWLAVSAYQPASTHSLRERIEGRVSMLVGMSGVGKSSLMMALKPGVRLTTQEVSSAHGKGKHTTSVTTLYPLNETTALIDSPGVWEYGLWSVPPERVLAAFPDLARYSDQCKFNDCKHLGEPGCAVRAAVDRDEVAQARLEAFQRIVRTLPAKALWERRS